MLHISASEVHRYDWEDYLLKEVGLYDRKEYRRIRIKNQREVSYMLIKKKIPLRILARYFDIVCDWILSPEDETYPLIDDLEDDIDEIELMVVGRMTTPIRPTLQYTIAIGYK